MLYQAGIIITFFLAVLLWTKKGKTAADHVLAAWLCLMGIHLYLFYVYITGDLYRHPFLLGLHLPIPMMHGPFLYLYTVTATRSNRFSPSFALHFLAPALTYVFLLPFFRLRDAEKIRVYQNHGAGFELEMSIILVAIILSGFAYVILSYRELRRYEKRIEEEFSNTEKINLNWLRYLTFGILVIWLIVLLDLGDPIVFGAVVVFVFLLGYFGIKHTAIFSYRMELPQAHSLQTVPEEFEQVNELVLEEEKSVPGAMNAAAFVQRTPEGEGRSVPELSMVRPKYEKSGLQKETIEKIWQDLAALMQNEKVFTNAELSLAELAKRLQVHPNNLSQVINTSAQKTFYDYINQLRITEFISLLQKPENQRYTLLSLAFECGFNSKSSFNRNFKKITGQSPSTYLKEINVQLAG